MRKRIVSVLALCILALGGTVEAQQASTATQVSLPDNKLLLQPIPGAPRPLNSFPATSVVSPDNRYVAILNQGWSVAESNFEQSIALLDLVSNKITDFPDQRLGHSQKQTYFYGLAWSQDGKHLYASIASLTDPEGRLPRTDESGRPGPGAEGDLGNGIVVYAFSSGVLAPERFIPIAPQTIPRSKNRAMGLRITSQGTALPYPAGIAVVASNGREELLIANNLADNAVLLEVSTGHVIHTFDLSEHSWIPAEYPLQIAASRDGKHAWVSLWNASKIVELDLVSGTIVRSIPLLPAKSPEEAGSHPTALLLTPDDRELLCALSNADSVAVVDTASGKVKQLLSTELPGERRAGVYPVALAQSARGDRLYVANATADAVAIFDRKSNATYRRLGFIPTEWYPTTVAAIGSDLIVTTAKGRGTGPNSRAWEPAIGRIARTNHPYIFALLSGSVARIDLREVDQNLGRLTSEVLESNRMNARQTPPPWRKSPIHRAIYIIKENRSYDQVFGDITEANGDPSLVMYGEDVTPNQHKLARQFGVLDNFYVSGEVSGDGHVWSTAAIASDYTEATIQINYRNAQRTYDYEGTNMDEVPLAHGLPDIDEPETGYLWANAKRHGITYRDYGEYIRGVWCNYPDANAEQCPAKFVDEGQPLPANVGQPHGGASPYPWKVPILADSIATKPELRSHFDPKYAGWNLDYPDQLRADEFLNEFEKFVQARREGQGEELPTLVIIRLPNNHTSGTRAGAPKPEAQVADNDLALGRIVDAVSHSPYWDDTAIFVLEDDAQNGPDHVDAHRSPALIISKYSRMPKGATSNPQPYVDSHFYTTVNMIRTVEEVTGIGPMNHLDAHAVPMWTMFSAAGSEAPFDADWRNRDNGLIYKVNAPNAPGAAESAQMDFSRADAVDSAVLNRILWRCAKGNVPMPATPDVVLPQMR
jgi:DNA-binding beta-propeller fold protein YncE